MKRCQTRIMKNLVQRVPEFGQVESEVKSEWIKDQRAEFKRQAYGAMKARYEIVLPTEQAVEAVTSSTPATAAATNSTSANETKTNGAPAWTGGLLNTPWRRHHPCGLAALFLRVLLLGGLTFAMSGAATACALCLGGRTLTISAQELVNAGRSVLALPDAGGKEFRVVEVIKGEHPPGDAITDTVFSVDPTAMRSTKPLLLIRDDAAREWVNWGPIAAEQADWLRQLAATKRTTGMNAAEWREHVAYLLPCLENPEPMVAEIAYAEFASAPYAALRSLKPRLDVAVIRKWSDDPTLALRQAVYTLLLGIAGGPQDAERLEKSLESEWKSNDTTNLGAMLAADLELRGPSRVAWIEEQYFVDHDRTIPEMQAALLAMGEQGRADAAVPRRRVIEAYRVFIREHEPLAGLVAKDLAEWRCWEFVPQFTALVHATGLTAQWYRNGLLYYLLSSRNSEAGAARPLPTNGWLRDPLLYFLVIGAALFAGYSAIRLKQR